LFKEIVYLKAKALLGTSQSAVLSVMITNCGTEEIITLNPDIIKPDIELDVQNGKWAEFDLDKVYESSNACTITEVGVFKDEAGSSPVNENLVKMFGRTLMINQNE